MEPQMSHSYYELREDLVDSELPNDMARTFNHHLLPGSTSASLHPAIPSAPHHAELRHVAKMESFHDHSFDAFNQGHALPAVAQLQLSDLEISSNWMPQELYPQVIDHHYGPSVAMSGMPLLSYGSHLASPSYGEYPSVDHAMSRSPWSSSPEFAYCRPLTLIEEDEAVFDDKPYAMLIYDALMQAPGHRMMLRDIYEWFRHNTTKPQESGSNGWQNSIRHNLSMNKAFENDRDQSSRSSSRKANSVWMLTEEAIKNGVQSTTRYRKTNGGRRSLGTRAPAIQRQRSGSKGGRALRRAARQRRQDSSFVTDTPLSSNPTTPSYSDLTEYHGFDYHDLASGVRSWPVTPFEDQRRLLDDTIPPLSLSPQSSFEFNVQQHTAYADDNLHLQGMFVQPTHELRMRD